MLYLNHFGDYESILFTDIHELHKYIMKNIKRSLRKYFKNDIERIFNNDRLDMSLWSQLLLFYLNKSSGKHFYKFKNCCEWILLIYDK